MKEKIAKAKKYIKVVEKLRVVLLCLALPSLLYVYFGQKMWGDFRWFEVSVEYIYIVLSYLVLAIVASSFGKVLLVMYYNSLVKKL